MKTLLLILASSFGLGILLTPLVRKLALRCGLVDRPDGRRKLHQQVIPLAGGLAIFLASTLSLCAVWLAPLSFRNLLIAQGTGLVGLLIASLIICAVGLVDDFGRLRGRHKLFGQLVAVGAVLSSGPVVQNIHLFGWNIELGPLALPFTALWLLGAINSLNLIDGMDGLLGCVGTIICLAVAVLAAASGQWAAAAVACALTGALLAFLCFNFPPASIFMGDCGSMLVGLVVGTIAIQGSLKGPATLALAAPTALLIIPIFDTLAAIVRRKLTGRSMYSTDRSHLHHCLLHRGLSNRRILLVVSGLCLVAVAGSLASVALDNELFAFVGALVVVLILVLGRLFGYAEFLLLKRRLVHLGAWILWRASKQPRQMEVHLQGSAAWAELWNEVTVSAGLLELDRVCLDVNAPAVYEGYHARWDRGGELEPLSAWRLEIPLLVHGQAVGRLEVTADRNGVQAGKKWIAVSRWIGEIEQSVARLAAVSPRGQIHDAEEVEATIPPPPPPFVGIERAVS